MGFPRQEYWSGFPFPSPGDLPDPGIKPTSPAGCRWVLYHCTTYTQQIFVELTRALNFVWLVNLPLCLGVFVYQLGMIVIPA